MVNANASDLFVSAHLAISGKINGQLEPLFESKLTAEASLALVYEAMTAAQKERFLQEKDCNFALVHALGRFRVSAFWQREQAGMVIRRIHTCIPTVEELNLPEVLKEIILAKRGLVLFVGGTGAGKSTSLAALLGYRNQHSRGHILTIEDPIEFIHPNGACLVTQREVGIDTQSFDAALKSALRQSPDVLLLGEIRCQETMESALAFAETGHLCIATLHANNANNANNANQALERTLHLVSKEKKSKLLYDLSLNLRAIVAQQLLPGSNGQSRVAAFEVLLNTPYVAELLKRDACDEIKTAMAKSAESGMQTFDQALLKLVQQQKISAHDALLAADSANDLRLQLKLMKGQAATSSGSLLGVTVQGL